MVIKILTELGKRADVDSKHFKSIGIQKVDDSSLMKSVFPPPEWQKIQSFYQAFFLLRKPCNYESYLRGTDLELLGFCALLSRSVLSDSLRPNGL